MARVQNAGRIFRPVTPNDNANLPDGQCDGMIFTTSGDTVIIDQAGNEVTLPQMATGVIHSIGVSRVKASGTTSGGIIAVYTA